MSDASESLSCDVCGSLATVHLTQIINNQIHKVDLCENCANYKGVTDADGFSLADLLAKNFSANNKIPMGTHQGSSKSGHACTSCGYTLDHFKKYGRLGCAECYVHLLPAIEAILGNMHKDVSHKGKVPTRTVSHIVYTQKIVQLEKEMNEAIKMERYEDAAQLRDEIEKMKLTMEGKTTA